MSHKIQKVQRVNKAYIGDGIAQIMTPFKDSYMSILSGDGLVYHNSSNYCYNKYLDDSRRFQFPYWSIPIHNEMKNGYLITYVNEIFDFGKPYIILKDGKVIQDLVFNIPNNPNSVFNVQRVLNPVISQEIKYVRMDDLDAQIHNSLDDSEGEKYIFSNGGVLSNDISYEDMYKDEMNRNVSKLIITINGGLISSVRGIKIFKRDYNFDLMVFDIPMVKYSMNMIKPIGRVVEMIPEPKVKRRFNPEVSRESIISSKTMAMLKN